MGAAPKQADTYRKGSRKTDVLGQDWEQRLAEARARRSAVLAAKGRGDTAEAVEKPWEHETFAEAPKLLDESRDNVRKAAVADHARGKRGARNEPALPDEDDWEARVAAGARRRTQAAHVEALPQEGRRRSRRGLTAAAALLLAVPVAGYVAVERFGLPSVPGTGTPEDVATEPVGGTPEAGPAATETAGGTPAAAPETAGGAPEGPAAQETAAVESLPGPVLSEPPVRSGAPDTAAAPEGEAIAALRPDPFSLPDGTPALPEAGAGDTAPGAAPAPPAASVPRGDPVSSAFLASPPTRNVPSAEPGARPAVPGPEVVTALDRARLSAIAEPGADGLSAPDVQLATAPVSAQTVFVMPGDVPDAEADVAAPRLASLDSGLPGVGVAPDLAAPPAAGPAPAVDMAAPEPLPAEPEPEPVAPETIAETPEPRPAPTVGTGTVFFHAPGTVDPALVEREAALVAEATGLDISVKEPVSFTISSSNVRYFHPEDREAAAAVADALSARLRDFTDFEPAPDVGTIEVWLEGEPEATAAASVAPAAVEPAPPPPPPAAAPAQTRRNAPVRARPEPAPTFSTTTITRTRPSGLGRIFGN